MFENRLRGLMNKSLPLYGMTKGALAIAKALYMFKLTNLPLYF